jgi:lipopolysaccharide transport system permease protein
MAVAGAFAALWRYRHFVGGSVRRQFAARYVGSALGASWNVVQPAITVLIYTLIFGSIMKAKMPGIDDKLAYGVYLCAGMFTWNLFAEIVGRMSTVFIENANVMKKTSFPRITLPAIVALSSLANFAVVFALFLLLLLVTDRFPGWPLLWCVPLLVIETALAVGMGMIAAVLNVFFRDVGQLVGIVVQFWFWLTPIVYLPTIVDQPYRGLFDFNPIYPLILGFQQIAALGGSPPWHAIGWVAALAFAALAGGYAVFRRHVGEMVDEL